MAGLLDTIKEKAKQQYQQGLLNQVINDPASIGRELGQLFDPAYMSQVKPMTQEGALDVALSAPMMALTTAGKVSNVLDDYAMAHRPPMKDSGAPLYDLTGGGSVYPSDVYSINGPQYYGTGDRLLDKEAWNIAKMVKDKPDAMVTMYRAVPSNVKSNKINNGDWVTISKKYAKNHGDSWLGGDYKILEQKVPARKLFTNADSWAEYGYDETGKILPEMMGLLGASSLGGLGYIQYKKQNKK